MSMQNAEAVNMEHMLMSHFREISSVKINIHVN